MWMVAAVIGGTVGGLLGLAWRSELIGHTGRPESDYLFLLYLPGFITWALGTAVSGSSALGKWVATVGNVGFYTLLAYGVLRFLAYRRTRATVTH
jgi:hypothetical protein